MSQLQQPLIYAACSDAGRVREHNEDALLCCPELGLWAIADGMGGHQCGEVASALALQHLRQACAEGQALLPAVHAANAAVVAAASSAGGKPGMGTTLVAVQMQGAHFSIAWVGDSRAYRVGVDQIDCLSHDHSWVQTMIDAGQMSVATARSHPQRNVILQCLGRADQSLEVGQVQGRLGGQELLLLCSDGLTGELEDEQIQQLCSQAPTLDALVQQLIEQAKQQGGKDNISCIVIGLGAMAVHDEEPTREQGFFSRLFNSRKP